MSILTRKMITNSGTLCQYCLKLAILDNWEEDNERIDIDKVSALIGSYRNRLAEVFSILNISYPPNVAWSLFYAFIREVESKPR